MILSTESTANLPKDTYEKLNVKMIPMQLILDGQTYDDLSEELNENFYEKMKTGLQPTTAQINEYSVKKYFEELLKDNQDIIHIGFSSALSGGFNTIKRVAYELNATNENKIYVIDSLNASFGQGLLVLKAHELIEQNLPINEIVENLENIKTKICSFFTVEQLKYLVRGGRINKVKGMIGSVLKIKPILHVDQAGRLVSYKNVISRKKSINELINICVENVSEKDKIYICHADSLADAEYIANSIEEKLSIRPQITELTQVIGSHTGPGLLAIFFLSNQNLKKSV